MPDINILTTILAFALLHYFHLQNKLFLIRNKLPLTDTRTTHKQSTLRIFGKSYENKVDPYSEMQQRLEQVNLTSAPNAEALTKFWMKIHLLIIAGSVLIIAILFISGSAIEPATSSPSPPPSIQ